MGQPLHPILRDEPEWPNTITHIIALRMRYDSYQELIEVPPEEHWDFPSIIRSHIDRLYPNMKQKTSTEYSVDEVED